MISQPPMDSEEAQYSVGKLHSTTSHCADVDFDDLPVVKRYPQVAKRALEEKRELQVTVRFHFAAAHQMQCMALPCMVDSGNQVIVVAGFEVFPSKLHEGAPRRLNLKGVGQNSPLAGGTVGVYTDRMELAVLNVSGLQLFQCSDVFIYLADVGPRVIIGFPFLIRYNLVLVPQCDYLVPGEVLNKYLKFVSGMQEDDDCTLCRPSSPCVHHIFAHSLQKSSDDWRCECNRIRQRVRMIQRRPQPVSVCSEGVVCSLRSSSPLTVRRVKLRIRDSITGVPCGEIPATDSGPEHHSLSPFEAFFIFSMLLCALGGRSANQVRSGDRLLFKKLSCNASAPVRGSASAAGLDLCSAKSLDLIPGQIVVVPTDFAITVPQGTYGRIAPRSGLGCKGIVIMGGVVDPDYTGNVGVVMGNIGSSTLSVNVGDRIAQLVCECIAMPVPIEVAELKSTERGGAGFGSTGVQAVTVKELNEPIFNSAAGPELDQGVLSMFIFLWIMFLPRVAPFFYFSAGGSTPGCSGTGITSHEAGAGCSSTAPLPTCTSFDLLLPSQSGQVLMGYQILPSAVQPGSKFEQEAHQLLDKLVCSSDPAGEPDIYSILYLRKWETDISDHGSDVVSAERSVDQMQGDRGRPGTALYPDDFMGGWGHARFPKDFTSVACLSADESAPLVHPQLELMGQIHPSVSQHMSAMSVSALHDMEGAADSSREQECVLKDRAQARRKRRPNSGDRQFRTDLFAAAEQWALGYGLKPTVDAFCSNKSSCLVTHNGVKRYWTPNQDAFKQSWLDEHLWLHPPDSCWDDCVTKILGDNARGLALVPTMKDQRWWWILGEVVVDWVDFSDPAVIFEPFRTHGELKVPYRLVFFDAMGHERESGGTPPPNQYVDPQKGGGNTDDWEPVRKVFRKRRGTKKSDTPPPCPTSPSQPPIPSPISGDNFLLLPSPQEQKRTQARQRITENRRRRRGQLGMSSPGSGFPSPQVAGLSDSESASMTDNTWDSATECGMTSESESEPEYCKYAYKNDFDSSSAPTGNGHQETGVQVRNLCYPRSVQSVIQTDLDHPDCQHYREQLLSTFKDSLFTPRGYDEDANEHRGPNAIVRLDFVENPKTMS